MIRPAWLDHPLVAEGVVELVPTAALLSIATPGLKPSSDLSEAGNAKVDPDKLWAEIVLKEMRSPFIISVGRNDRMKRLEGGNRRIQLFVEHGIGWAPATVLVGETAIVSPGEGQHAFPCGSDLRLAPTTPGIGSCKERRYFAPSEVFFRLRHRPIIAK